MAGLCLLHLSATHWVTGCEGLDPRVGLRRSALGLIIGLLLHPTWKGRKESRSTAQERERERCKQGAEPPDHHPTSLSSLGLHNPLHFYAASFLRQDSKAHGSAKRLRAAPGRPGALGGLHLPPPAPLVGQHKRCPSSPPHAQPLGGGGESWGHTHPLGSAAGAASGPRHR